MITNGYVLLYLPDHPRAMSNGCVYEHIVQAEKKLGRFLSDKEVVHHKDRNRTNNNADNLMVFKTVRDRTLFHVGMPAFKENDIYIVMPEYKKYICPICGREKARKDSKMCIDCRNKEKANNIPTKDELIKLLKQGIPYTKIGELYSVSDNAVRKWCKKYGIPRTKSERKTFGM